MARTGERHHYAKLTADRVRDIRARWARGDTVRNIWLDHPDIASEGTINAVIYNRTWRHVT